MATANPAHNSRLLKPLERRRELSVIHGAVQTLVRLADLDYRGPANACCGRLEEDLGHLAKALARSNPLLSY